QRARDALRARTRAGKGGNLPAAVGGQLHVLGEQRLEPQQVALLGGRKESSCQLVALLPVRVEAGSALLDVASRSRRKLTYVVLALAYDLGDFWVVIVEDVVKQQHGS